MLLTMSAYTALTYAAKPVDAIAVSLGLAIVFFMGALASTRPRQA